MFLRQIEYFQSVVRNNSFTLAAEEHHISQSAISQQIRALEDELGVELLARKNRRFTLTEAGEHFYKRSLVITADLEQLCRETVRLGQKDAASLSAGFLITYDGDEFTRALAAFAEAYPAVTVNIMSGNHEDLYDALRFGRVDLVLNDQRRAFSDEYENHILAESVLQVELATHNPLSQLPEVEIADLRQLPCILVASREQQEEERRYYRDIVGFKGEFLFAGTMQEARVMAVSNRGVLPVEGHGSDAFFGATLKRVPLVRNGSPVRRTYCAFWKKNNANPHTTAFAELLKKQFA